MKIRKCEKKKDLYIYILKIKNNNHNVKIWRFQVVKRKKRITMYRVWHEFDIKKGNVNYLYDEWNLKV